MCAIQLNKYETAPCFLLLNQNLMTDCLLIYVFLPLLTYFYLLRTWNWVFIFRTILGSQQVRMGKNTKINKQFVVIFRLNWRKYGSVSLAVLMFMKKIFLNLPSVLAILPASQEFWSQSSTWIQLRQNIRRASCAAVRTKMVSISPWFTQKLNLKWT